MAGTRIHHFKDFSIKRSGVEIELDMGTTEENFNRAQFELDSAVMTSMEKLMPMNTGSLIDRTKAESAALAGSGKVIAAVGPYGRFLYMGKVMVGERSKSAWAKKGEKKIVTANRLTFERAAARPKWFDYAKSQYGEMWVRVAKRAAGGK